MKESEFKDKFHFRSIEKCCWTCKHCYGYNDELQCHHLKDDISFNTLPFNMCDRWENIVELNSEGDVND